MDKMDKKEEVKKGPGRPRKNGAAVPVASPKKGKIGRGRPRKDTIESGEASKDATKKIPVLSPTERLFCHAMVQGQGEAQSFRVAFPKIVAEIESQAGGNKDTAQSRVREKARSLLRKPHIQQFIEYVNNTPTLEIAADTLREALIFEDGKQRQAAAKIVLDHDERSAKKDSIKLWLDVVSKCSAEFVTHCSNCSEEVRFKVNQVLKTDKSMEEGVEPEQLN